MSFTEWFTESLDSVSDITGSAVDNIGGIYTKLDAFMSDKAVNTTTQPNTVEHNGKQIPVQESGYSGYSNAISTNTILIGFGSLGGFLLMLKVFKVI